MMRLELRCGKVQQVADGRAIQIGHVRDGSTIVELAALLVNGTIWVQVLAVLFKKGPEIDVPEPILFSGVRRAPPLDDTDADDP